MSNEKTASGAPSLDKSDPTNARLAALMVEQTGKVLHNLARLAKLLEVPSLTLGEIAGQIEDALRQDATLEVPKFSNFGRFYLSQLVLKIRCPLTPIERWTPAEPDPEADEPAEPVIEFTPVSWEEYGERINAALAKSAKKEREMTAMLDGVMAAGLLATTEKGPVALALANMFVEMLPNGEPMVEIPEDWVPVVLAINPMTGDFLTIAGPRSGPDGRVEAVETMFARQMQNSVAGAVGAVREAGRPQTKRSDETRPIAKPRDLARPQPKPGEPDYVEYVITGPIDEFSCETCRHAVGERVSPNTASDYLEDLQRDCDCENGCRLTVKHPDDLETEEESEE